MKQIQILEQIKTIEKPRINTKAITLINEQREIDTRARIRARGD
jgi:hypothetical protein